MGKLLLAVSLLIVYGSLYPFNFSLDAYDPGLLPGLTYFGLGRTGGGDLISNVVLFLPFGFLAMQSTRNRASWSNWLLILGLGFVFAYAIQVVQLIVPKRVPSGSDAVWNVVGCALGCLLGMIRMPRIFGMPAGPAGPLPVPTLLAVCLILWNLRPFVPSLDLQNITDNLKHLLSSPTPQPLWVFQDLVAWLLVFHFLDRGEVKFISEKRYPLLILLVLGLGLFVVGNSITIDRIVGALLALPAWKVLKGLPRPPILCLSTFIVIVGIGFTPFELRAEPIDFKWIPFQGALGGNMFINVLATTKKMLLYGCLIYLLVEMGLRLRISTLVVSVFLFFSESLQIYFQRKTPEITDSILALMIGISFYIWEDHRRKSVGIEGHPASNIANSFIGPGRSQTKSEVEKATMVESSDTPQPAAQKASGPRHELQLNLRRSQAIFLRRLSAETSLDPSDICQRLIDTAVSPEADWQDDPLYGAALEVSAKPSARGSRERKWTKVTVTLDDLHFGRLSALAADSNASESKMMRHVLSDCMDQLNTLSGPRRKSAHSVSSLRAILKSKPYPLIAMVILAGVVLLSIFFALRESRLIKVGPHWAANEANLILDHHTHTSYSDGRLSAGELVDLAFESGCDALVISDHSDTEGTVSDEQMSELENLRGQYPDLLLFSGIELNMPSYGGREHAGLIADPLVEAETLQQLRDLAERNLRRAKKGGASPRSDVELLQKIADYQALRNGLLLVYNHPSREDQEIEENVRDITNWNARRPVFFAMEGAPGHQNARAVGKYEPPFLTEDGWDPAVAEIGGAWDQLLSDGHQLWAALASSDYHNAHLDKPPCGFARTHLLAPEWSYRGVLMSLKAGTFWADHGRILDQLWFSVDVDGLEQSAYPGYIVQVGDLDSAAVVSLTLDRGPGGEGQPLMVEIIGNCSSGDVELLLQRELAPGDSTLTTLLPLAATGQDGSSCFLRARVRLLRDSSPDYLAYTNPVRLILN